MARHILLTGGTGFLGSHILDRLVSDGWPVVVLIRKTSNEDRIRHLKGRYATFSLDGNGGNIDELFTNYDVEAIIHTATEYGRGASMTAVMETNVMLPLKLVEEGVKHGLDFFMNTDSFFAKKRNLNSSYLNHYAKSKDILRDILAGGGLKLKIASLRLEHVFGENDSEQKFVTSVFRKLLLNVKEIPLTEGLQKRDFIYVGDVVDAFLKVLENRDKLKEFSEFEVGRGRSMMVRDFVEKAAGIAHSSSKLLFGRIENRPGEIEDSSADISALTEIGWKAGYSIDEAIEKVFKTERNILK